MKRRNGFVSNSSSSSFILKRKHLTPIQEVAIKYYDEFIVLAKKYANHQRQMEEERKDPDKFVYDDIDEDNICWDIIKRKDRFTGKTSMDNFSMKSWFEFLGISRDDFDFCDSDS